MADQLQSVQIKTVFLGEASVGKSSILGRFVDDRFDETIQATSGADFKVKSIVAAGKKIDFHLWDTAGQERFRSLAQLYYKDASVACIVYDVTNQNSFKTLNYWLKELKQHAKEDIIKVIIGNKIDLASSSNQKHVQVDQAQNLAKQNDALQLLTSAKDGTGIQEMFQKIAAQISQRGINPQPRVAAMITKPQPEKKKPKCC